MIYFILGIIVGLLINPTKEKITKYMETINKDDWGKSQFIEPISLEEKFKKSKNIDEMLK